MKEPLWRALALLLQAPWIQSWLWARAQRRPYEHLPEYMGRWWVFRGPSWLPHIRMHHIMREDRDRHLHDHPWDARTIILAGHYVEERIDGRQYVRAAGDTAALKHGEFHRIAQVSDGGVWTLFMTWPRKGPWGFLVNGRKITSREYLS